VEARHPVTLEPATTIADGIAVRRAGGDFQALEVLDRIFWRQFDEIRRGVRTASEFLIAVVCNPLTFGL
jgi:hypothetical protein